MRLRLSFVAPFVFLLWLSLLTPAVSGETTILIPWDTADPLIWSDFQGTPPADAAQHLEAAWIVTAIKMSAGTYVDQNESSGYVGCYTNVVIANYMNPDKSWVLPSAACTSLLEHEQGHFDLTEAYARRAALIIESTRLYGTDKYAVEQQLFDRFSAIRDEIYLQADRATQRYDDETNHGLNATEQARWLQQIDAWLASPGTIPEWDS